MKTVILILSFFFILKVGISQTDTTKKEKIALNRLIANFAVPDLPAFKALGNEPSNILRPSDVKKLSIIVPQFVDNGQAILPKAFALEVSPFLLIKSNQLLTFDEIKKKQFVKSIRLSIGTSRDTIAKQPNASKLGIGLRFTVFDKTNIEINSDLLKMERDFFLRELWIDTKLEDEFKKNNDIKKADDLTPEQAKKFEQFKKDKKVIIKAFEIDSLREMFKKRYWNKEKLDFAIGYVGRSPDQFIKNLGFNKLSAWGTLALPVKTWGQFLIGANANNNKLFNEITKSLDNYLDGNLNARLYAGNNKFKAYSEFQATFNEFNKSNSSLFFVGGEYNILDGFWINFYLGLKKPSGMSSTLISNFDMKFTIPEK